LHVGRLGALHADCALLGGVTPRRTLDVENETALRKKSGDLSCLYSSNFLLIHCDAEDWNLSVYSQLSQIIDITVNDRPSDSLGDGGMRHLGEAGSNRVTNDRVGSGFRCALNGIEKLLTLIDGVAFGVDDLGFCAEPIGHLCDRASLFALIVVFIGNERNQ